MPLLATPHCDTIQSHRNISTAFHIPRKAGFQQHSAACLCFLLLVGKRLLHNPLNSRSVSPTTGVDNDADDDKKD